eukprot:scpid104696/ scgid4217/ 
MHREAAFNAKRCTGKQRAAASENDFKLVEQAASLDGARRLGHLASRGVSSWLNPLPLREHGDYLSKGDFRDALVLRYDWALADVPLTCSCGRPFSAVHAMSCPTGGFSTIRHNEV